MSHFILATKNGVNLLWDDQTDRVWWDEPDQKTLGTARGLGLVPPTGERPDGTLVVPLTGPQGPIGLTGPPADTSMFATDAELGAEAQSRLDGDSTLVTAVNTAQATADAAVERGGDTMTGPLVLSGDPTTAMQAATRQYVLAQIGDLIAGAPGTLDTLNEIAAQLGSDQSAIGALAASVAGALQASANLGDLSNVATAWSNLGLGTAAGHAVGDFDAAGAAASAQAASQPLNSGLSAIAALNTTAFGRARLTDADAAATRAAIGAENVANKNVAGGYAGLDGAAKIQIAALPALAISTVQTAGSQATQLALTAEEGDICVRTDENKSYIHNAGSSGTMADWTLLATPGDLVISVAGKTGAVTLTSADLTDTTAFSRSFLAVADSLAARTALGVTRSYGVVTALPTNPTPQTGDTCTLTDSLTTPSYYWDLVYNGSDSGSFKWAYKGGSPFMVEVANAESTTSTSYTSTGFTAMSFTTPYAGDYDISQGGTNWTSVAGDALMSYAIGAGAAVDADSVAVNHSAGNREISPWRTKRKTGLAAATAIVCKYRTSTGTGFFSQRALAVQPKRIG